MTDTAIAARETALNNVQNRGWFNPMPELFADNAAAYAAQDSVMSQVAAGRGGVGGYKIAYNTPPMLEKLGQDVPGVAYVCAGQIHQDGAELASADYENLMIEPEIAAILGQDMIPDKTYTPKDVRAAVARWCPAFELLDRRNTDGHFHVPTVLAHNIFNEGAVLGAGGVANLPPMDSLTSQVFDGGKQILDAVSSAPQDPVEAACHLINHFTGRGHVMKAGAVLLCGTHMAITAPTRGQVMRFDLGALGSVSFRVD